MEESTVLTNEAETILSWSYTRFKSQREDTPVSSTTIRPSHAVSRADDKNSMYLQ